MLKLTHRLGLRVLWAAQAGSQQACGRSGRGSAPQPVEGGGSIAMMPQNPGGWCGQPSSPAGVILSSAAADPTNGFLRRGEMVSFLPNFMMVFAAASASSSGIAQKIVNKTEI